MQHWSSAEPARSAWDSAVGRLVQAAADAEARLTRLVRVLAQLDGPAVSVLLAGETSATADAARQLLRSCVRDPRLRDDLLGWVAVVTRLCALRATVVHTVWERRCGEDCLWPVWSRPGVEAGPMSAAELSRTTTTLARRCGPPSDELLLRLDKAQPELAVYSRA